MDSKMPSRNISPYGWWVASLIERFEFDDEDRSNLKRRCRAFTNVVIFKAADREEAYRKAMEYGELGIENKSNWSDHKGRKGRWIFEGLNSLLPIYDEIDEDGTEIFFEDEKNISVGRVKSRIREKMELEAFDDSPREA